MGCDLPILAYHKVDPRRELGLNSLSPQRFERQIRFLKNEGYKSISPQSLISCAADTSSLTRPILITLDDGYEGAYSHVYPILKEYVFTAIIFVTTGYIGKYNNWDSSPGPRFKHLNWAHIREMADSGIWFGSHGVNHAFLTRQSDSVARYEIEASKNCLEDGLGRPIHFFSYPYGNYDDRIMNLAREAGYKAAFSLRPEFLKAGYNGGCKAVYALPRIAIYLLDNMWLFKSKIGCVRSGSISCMQKLMNRLINRCAYASILVDRLGTKESDQ